ncbi:MAG: hypothetical protein H0T79_14690, partial [Deltaproteobacteria bacterium]|nr:hypothetical protein [Deltaproteobacteria bacterium]
MGAPEDDTGGGDAPTLDGSSTLLSPAAMSASADEPATDVIAALPPEPAAADSAVIDLNDVLEVVDELPVVKVLVPPAQPPRRASSNSIPPPIPSAERRKRSTTISATTLEPGPIVVNRAPVDHTTRAEQIAKDLEVRAVVDPTGAASLAYELGELYERRLADEDRALGVYRRAFELDASLRPNLWALRRMLYRGALWPELVTLIDTELGATTDDRERVDLLLERALVHG